MSAVFPMDPSQRGIRPAYVRFTRSSREDRDASIRAGHVVETHSDLALITPPGSKDVIEREVKSWMEYLAYQEREGAIPGPLVSYYRDIYERWCHGQEMPPAGTPILGWQLLAATEQQRVIGSNILTVEDLAEAGHLQMQEIGMGAPAMVEKAKHWLQVGRDHGAAAMELSELKVQCERMQEEIRSLVAQLSANGRKPRADKGLPRGPRKRGNINGIDTTTDSSGGST